MGKEMKKSFAGIQPDQKVGETLDRFPYLLDVFLAHGFTLLVNPVMRRTVAPRVTIEKACRAKGVDLHAFLRELNAAIEMDAEEMDGKETRS